MFDRTGLDLTLNDRPGRARLPFSVDCNQTMDIAVTTRNGGMALQSQRGFVASPGFIALLPYDLDFSIDRAGAQTITFNSENLRESPGTGSFGVIPFVTRGALELSWSPSLPLIGGEYGDVIEIRVSGRGETNGPA